MSRTVPWPAAADACDSVLRCTALPPPGTGPSRAASGRGPSGLTMLRRGSVVLAALALPVLGAVLADPVQRARQPRATQAAAVLRSPLGEAAAAPRTAPARIVVGALGPSDAVRR